MRFAYVALLGALSGLPSSAHADVWLDFVNPDGLFKPSTFTQMVIARGERVVFISGQTARDLNANVVGGGDSKRQTEKALQNIRIAVEAAGGSSANVAKITTYVVNLRPDDRVWIGELVKKHFPRPPAHTLIGVSALAAPELLVEIEAIAVLD